jgi:hypothetical protein
MKTLLAAMTAVILAVGCADATTPSSDTHPTTMFTRLTTLQACQRLQAHITRNQVRADLPILHYIADHVTATTRLARDARDAVKDITHTGIAPIPFLLLKDDCTKVGVDISIP